MAYTDSPVMRTQKRETLSIRLHPDTLTELNKHARRHNLSKGRIVELALERYFDEEEQTILRQLTRNKNEIQKVNDFLYRFGEAFLTFVHTYYATAPELPSDPAAKEEVWDNAYTRYQAFINATQETLRKKNPRIETLTGIDDEEEM